MKYDRAGGVVEKPDAGGKNKKREAKDSLVTFDIPRPIHAYDFARNSRMADVPRNQSCAITRYCLRSVRTAGPGAGAWYHAARSLRIRSARIRVGWAYSPPLACLPAAEPLNAPDLALRATDT